MSIVTQEFDDDCLRCAVAALLDLEREEVPHFVREAGQDCWVAARAWAATRGLLLEIRNDDPGIPCIARGVSPRDPAQSTKSHAVVWHRGLAWDPHPSRDGLLGAPSWYATITAEEAP